MNVQKVISGFIPFLFIIIISGCAQSVQTLPTVSSITSTNTISVTVEAKISTPTVTNTPLPTAALTNTPTLSAEDARQNMLVLLANNRGCRLPCLWGITPGASHFLRAQEILMPLSNIAETAIFDSSYFGGGILIHIDEGYRFNVSVSYLYKNDIVNRINFRTSEENLAKKDEYGNQIKIPVFDSQAFKKRTEYYSLSHLLSKEGMPDTVLIQSSGLPVGGGMDIAVLYPDQGIWANYSMIIISNNGVIKRACPANSHIEMELFPPGDPASFFSLLDATDWGVTKNGYMPLEKATSLTLEEFYQAFRNPTDKCIETPARLWPTPEPGGG